MIFLHGLGDTGNGWAGIFPELSIPHLKFIAPTAPTRPITVNMNMSMPGWFDVHHLDLDALEEMMAGKPFDPQGVEESIAYIRSLIQNEIQSGISANRIVIGGFSQGGHIALKTALRQDSLLAGCVGLSTWMEPPQRKPSDLIVEHLPVFIGHGSADPLIPSAIASMTLNILQEKLHMRNIEAKFYTGMGHSSCPLELEDLKRFLLKVLPDTPIRKEAILDMSAKELKVFISGRGESPSGLFEKRELVEKALSLL